MTTLTTLTPTSRKITLKRTSETHREAVQAVASVLQCRADANRVIGEGLATPGTRAAFSAEITRKIKAAQPTLKAARREAKEATAESIAKSAEAAKVARINGKLEHFFANYSYLTKAQIAVIHAHEGWAGR